MLYLIALWAAAAWILFRLIDSWFTSRRQAKVAEKLGCKEPIVRPNPIPFGADFVTNALKADRAQIFPEYMQGLYNRMSRMTYRHHILGGTGFSTCDPKNIQAILATQFKDFGLGERRQAMFKPLLGVGIFTADGRIWEHSRAMMRPQFNRDQVSDLDLEEQHLQNLMHALPTDAVSGWTQQTDLSPLFFRLTLDSACEFLFGESVDSQLAALPSQLGLPSKKSSDVDEKAFTLSFDRGQAWLAKRARFFDKYWLVDGPQARRDIAATHRFVDYFVRRALAHNSRDEKDIESAGAKSRYVFLEALAEQTRNPIELRDQMLNILLAGRDTTASLLGWTFWLLARHPEVFTKLRSTILTSFGPYSNTSSITFTSLKNCTYLQHVINEVLRLYPVVPGNFRAALKDTTLPRGGGPNGDDPIFIPKGSQVDYSVFVMHRHTALWGQDAAEFKPNRWEGRKVGWEYLPFNGGPRICIGQQFALTEASYVITRLLQRFDRIENMDEQIHATYNYTLTACPARGVRVRLHEAAAGDVGSEKL